VRAIGNPIRGAGRGEIAGERASVYARTRARGARVRVRERSIGVREMFFAPSRSPSVAVDGLVNAECAIRASRARAK